MTLKLLLKTFTNESQDFRVFFGKRNGPRVQKYVKIPQRYIFYFFSILNLFKLLSIYDILIEMKFFIKLINYFKFVSENLLIKNNLL